MKFGRLIKRALLHITPINEVWPKRSPCRGAKIAKGVKIVTLLSESVWPIGTEPQAAQ